MIERLPLIQVLKQFSSRILLNSRHFYFIENVNTNRNKREVNMT